VREFVRSELHTSVKQAYLLYRLFIMII